MSTVYSYAVGNQDLFSIEHNSDRFTTFDCSMSAENTVAFSQLHGLTPIIRKRSHGTTKSIPDSGLKGGSADSNPQMGAVPRW